MQDGTQECGHKSNRPGSMVWPAPLRLWLQELQERPEVQFHVPAPGCVLRKTADGGGGCISAVRSGMGNCQEGPRCRGFLGCVGR